MTRTKLSLVATLGLLLVGAPASAQDRPHDGRPRDDRPRDAGDLPSVPARPSESGLRDIRVQVVPVTSSTIGAPMAGRLTEFPLRDGDRFEKGQVLARFACAEREGALARARAVLAGKRRVLSNRQQLRSLGNSTGLDYDIAAADVAEAAADLTTAEALVESCTVTAPFSGRVADVAAHAFQFVALGAPMLEILSDRNLELEMIVPSRWLSWLAPGAAFDVMIDETGHTYHAALTRVSGKVDPVSRSVKLYGRITVAADDLLPGMSGRALIVPPGG